MLLAEAGVMSKAKYLAKLSADILELENKARALRKIVSRERREPEVRKLKARNQQIFQLRMEGKTFAELERITGVSKDRCRQIAQALGAPKVGSGKRMKPR